MGLHVVSTRSLSSVDPAAWDALQHHGSPFLEHGFLSALERSRSIGPGSGWDPHYLLAEWVGPGAAANGPAVLVGALACFVKHHSYGEYIFDFPWARAAQRSGIRYYPKLVIAAPVTPATGPRILLRAPVEDAPDPSAVADALVEAARALADDADCSSIHWLFHRDDEGPLLERHGFVPRASFQYHWRNPIDDGRGYPDFEAFLAGLTSRKRKQIRKERARAQAAVDDIAWIRGDELSDDDLAAIDRFYRHTTDDHGGQDYLRPGFFEALRETLPHRIAWVRARRDGRTIAGALYLETDEALYGRYWGCDVAIEFLHFELAYYRGIERCIARGLPLFEAGAQGEHKLLRGFAPSPTHSAHWIRHPGLREGVQRFLAEERRAVSEASAELATLQPYKHADGGRDDGE